MVAAHGFDRASLQAELDQLQRDYNAGKLSESARLATPPSARRGAAEVFAPVLAGAAANGFVAVERDSSALFLSPAERALAQIAAANRNVEISDVGRAGEEDDLWLRKDGLDLILTQLRSDAARLRAYLSGVGLAIDQPRRKAALDKVRKMPLPQDVIRQFQDQQRLIAEQRRVLDELRRERHLAEEEQFWFARGNRLQYLEDSRVAAHGRIKGQGGNTTCIEPAVLAEEHLLLRAEQRRRVATRGYPQGLGALRA